MALKAYYEHGGISIYHGDCREVLPTLPKCDLVLTDPPYRMRGGKVPIHGQGVAAPLKDYVSVGEPWGFDLEWLDYCIDAAHMVIFCNSYMIGGISARLEMAMTPVCLFTWHKTNAPPNIRNTPKWDCEFVMWFKSPKETNRNASAFKSQLFQVPMPQAGCFAGERILERDSTSAAHPTQKPIAVVLPFVCNISNENSVILDPFMGLGTTLRAAKELGRQAIGIEIEERYCEIAAKRLSQEVLQFG